MLRLSLRPYPGTIELCADSEEFQRRHKKLFGYPDKDLSNNRGRMVGKFDTETRWPTYIIFGENKNYLAHEFSHVIFHVFELAGIDPTAANNEPFCYLLSQLLLDSDRL